MIRAPQPKTLAKAVAIIIPLTAGAEGMYTKVYLDPVGIPTQCFGETLGVHLGDPEATPEQCRDQLTSRLQEYDDALGRCLSAGVPVEVRAALLDLSYNAGTDAVCKSTAVRKANSGDLRGACDEQLRWNKARLPTGQLITLPGLTKRRQTARTLCLQGIKPTGDM